MRSPVLCAGACAGVLLALFFSGCAYSFTGASVPPHLKTIAIPLVDDQSGLGEPGLREKFTTELIQLFTSDNSLEVADRSRRIPFSRGPRASFAWPSAMRTRSGQHRG